jgi:hypothetical protein
MHGKAHELFSLEKSSASIDRCPLGEKYQIDPTWAAAVGVVYFSDSFASSDGTVRLPRFVRVDAAACAKINENWEGAAQCREYLQ